MVSTNYKLFYSYDSHCTAYMTNAIQGWNQKACLYFCFKGGQPSLAGG